MSYKKTKRSALIKNRLGGGEYFRDIYKKGNKYYVKMWNKYIPIEKMNVIDKVTRVNM